MTLKDQVRLIVARIPSGKVAYFGQIREVLAAEFDTHTTAQVIGWIMSGVPQKDYEQWPGWHRVVVKNGFVASLKLGYKGILQIELLRKEGVEIIENIVDMSKYCVSTSLLAKDDELT
jgi:alkylated DNA nucleotide flippase Atl1